MVLNPVSYSRSSTHSRTDNAPDYGSGEWGFDSLWVRMAQERCPDCVDGKILIAGKWQKHLKCNGTGWVNKK